MAVLVKITNHGIRKPAYDEIAKQLIPALQQQPGFRYHFSYADGDELVVNEIWDSAAQQRAWFDGSVRPNLPPDHTPKVDVTELYYTAGP